MGLHRYNSTSRVAVRIFQYGSITFLLPLTDRRTSKHTQTQTHIGLHIHTHTHVHSREPGRSQHITRTISLTQFPLVHSNGTYAQCAAESLCVQQGHSSRGPAAPSLFYTPTIPSPCSQSGTSSSDTSSEDPQCKQTHTLFLSLACLFLSALCPQIQHLKK